MNELDVITLPMNFWAWAILAFFLALLALLVPSLVIFIQLCDDHSQADLCENNFVNRLKTCVALSFINIVRVDHVETIPL